MCTDPWWDFLLRKKLVEILINNENMHNVPSIYDVLHKSFKGYKRMWDYLKMCDWAEPFSALYGGAVACWKWPFSAIYFP